MHRLGESGPTLSARDEELDSVRCGSIEAVQLGSGLMAHQCRRPERREPDAESLLPARRCSDDTPHPGCNPFESTGADVIPDGRRGDAQRGEVLRADDPVLRRSDAGNALPLIECHAPVWAARPPRRSIELEPPSPRPLASVAISAPSCRFRRRRRRGWPGLAASVARSGEARRDWRRRRGGGVDGGGFGEVNVRGGGGGSG